MKNLIALCALLGGFACGILVRAVFSVFKAPWEEAPAIVWRSSNGTTLATGTPSRGKSYFFDNLESVTFSAPKYKSDGVVITTKP